MFAIAVIAGKQYKVQKGDMVDVDAVKGSAGDTLEFSSLLVSSGDAPKTKTSTSGNKIIKAKIVKQFRGKKVDVRRFKSKVRYRRHNGFRSSRTQLEILSVE